MRAGLDVDEPPSAGTMPEAQRQQHAIDALVAQRGAVHEALSSLGRLVVPPSRQQIHDKAVAALTLRQAALDDLIAAGSEQNLTATRAQAAVAAYAEALDHVKEVDEEIGRLRFGTPTE